MKKFFTGLAVLVLAIFVIFLAHVATLPDDWRIERSAAIQAPPEKIYPLIADLQAMNRWNPFAQQDPSIKIAYGSVTSGKGANYSWDSTGDAGKGHMEIVDTVPQTSVAMRLTMEKPMAARNNVVFLLDPKGESTQVTWSMTGRHNFLTKTLCAIFNADQMVGGEFAKGLRALKQMAEA